MHPMLNIAIRAARAGGRVLTKYMDRLDSVTIEEKGKNNLVSEVDRLTEAEVVSVLQKSYPDHQFICEESGTSGNDTSDFKWYIDPLDGTKNYLHGYPSFCVSIAVAIKDRLDQAVIYDPVSQELFAASRGAGATLDGKRLRVSKQVGLENALLSSGYSNNGKNDFDAYLKTFVHFTKSASGMRTHGSAALELAYVAAGRIDGYWQYGLKPWDLAAGALIVREAGGLVTDMQGEGNWLTSGNIVAATPRVFDPMIHSLRSLKVYEI